MKKPPRGKHGMCGSAEYKVWHNMLSRCRNKNSTYFQNYGGRGIAVCERWEQFELFFADMGRRPSRLHSLDRIDNDQGYRPGNCRWATKKEQALNTRATLNLTGQVFGRLTVLERADGRHWKCRCECGTIKFVTSCNLRGKTTSCGCRRAELNREFWQARRMSHAS